MVSITIMEMVLLLVVAVVVSTAMKTRNPKIMEVRDL